jgi:hypothetical protein
MPVNRLFKRPAKKQYHQNEGQAKQNISPFAGPASRTDTSSQPNASCSGKPVHMVTVIAAYDNASTQKSDSGHNTLKNAARVGAAGLTESKNG